MEKLISCHVMENINKVLDLLGFHLSQTSTSQLLELSDINGNHISYETAGDMYIQNAKGFVKVKKDNEVISLFISLSHAIQQNIFMVFNERTGNVIRLSFDYNPYNYGKWPGFANSYKYKQGCIGDETYLNMEIYQMEGNISQAIGEIMIDRKNLDINYPPKHNQNQRLKQ